MKFEAIRTFLVMVLMSLTQETKALLNSGNLAAKDSTLYIRKKVTAGGIVKLIDGETRQVVGLTNIDGNKLEQTRNFIITALGIKYGTDASITDPRLIDFNSTAIPKALRNAELSVTQGSKSPVKIDVSTLIAGRNASPSSVEADRFNLKVWALIKEQATFELNLEFPDGSDFGTGNHFVEVRLFGAETYKA